MLGQKLETAGAFVNGETNPRRRCPDIQPKQERDVWTSSALGRETSISIPCATWRRAAGAGLSSERSLDSTRSHLGRFFGIAELPLLHRPLEQPRCSVDWHSLRPVPCSLKCVSHTVGRPNLSGIQSTSDDPLILLRILFVCVGPHYRCRWVFAVWRRRRSVLRMLCETTVCRRSVIRMLCGTTV